MSDALISIANATIPGLLAGRLAQTGQAQLITSTGAVPVSFSETSSGVAAAAAVLSAGAPEAACAYVEAAAGACGWTCCLSEQRVWVRTVVDHGPGLVHRVNDFCRLTRQIAGCAGWLAADSAAGSFWKSLAPAQSTKGGTKSE